MAVNKELTEFVKEGIGRGLPREQLHGVLISAGWPADQVQTAFSKFADVTFPIPVPRPKPYLWRQVS